MPAYFSGLTQFRYALALLLAFSATVTRAADCPGADAKALEWLDKMSRNIQRVSYSGVATLQRNGDMQVLQFSHQVDQGHSTERLTELTGAGAQVERPTHPLDCVHPGQKLLRLGAALQADECALSRQYRFHIAGEERIAGRNAVRLDVTPRDVYRYGYVMYMDEETGLLLKSVTIGHGHRVLEKFQFAQLSYGDESSEVDNVGVIHQAEHPEAGPQNPRAPVSRPWTVNWLPRGFLPTDNSAGVNRRRTYTDGMAVFSVFLEALGQEIRPGEGVVRHGGTTSYTRGMRLEDEPVLVTVVGEIPLNTARMVADKIGWEQVHAD